MKTAQLAQRLSPLLTVLRCPRCGGTFCLTDQSLVCQGGHCYDLSRRGYVNLAPAHNQTGEKYDESLFESRRTVLESGFYKPVLQAICAFLPDERSFTLLDVGCGEGYYARRISARFPLSQILGIDLSRDAIMAAARVPGRETWLVADLKQLPLAPQSVDYVLDVLTPADYKAFSRVLKPDGLLIKAVPGADYLQQVRQAVSPWLRGSGTYDNTRVLEHLHAHARVVDQTEVHFTLPVTPELSRAFAHMTPMTFSVPQEALNGLEFPSVTIHMHVLACRLHV